MPNSCTLRRKGALASLLLALLAGGPIVARAAQGLVEASRLAEPVCMTWSPKTIWAFEGHCKGLAHQVGYEAEMSYNALGLRDRDYPPFPAPGVFRILVMGSSGLVGPGLAEPQNPVRQMERALRDRGYPVEVINGATEGYFTTQNAIRLRELLEAYHPNLVVFDFGQSGVYSDAALESATRYEGERPVSIDVNPLNLLPEKLRPMVGNNSRLISKLATVSEMWRRIRVTWSARFAGGISGGDERRTAERFLSHSMRLLRFMVAETAQFRVPLRILHDEAGTAATDWAVPPGLDFNLASRLARFAVPIQVSAPRINEMLASEKLPMLPIQRVSGIQYSLGGDYHYSAFGAQQLGTLMASAVEPMLPAKRPAAGGAKRPKRTTGTAR